MSKKGMYLFADIKIDVDVISSRRDRLLAEIDSETLWETDNPFVPLSVLVWPRVDTGRNDLTQVPPLA